MGGNDLAEQLGLKKDIEDILLKLEEQIPDKIKTLKSKAEKLLTETTQKKIKLQYFSFLQYLCAEDRYGSMLMGIENVCFDDEDAFTDDEDNDFHDIMSDPTSLGYLLFVDDKPMGYFVGSNDTEELPEELVGNSFYIASWGLLPEIQGKGVSKPMMDLYVDTIKETGYTNILFHTRNTAVNIRMFRSMGFRLYKVIENYYIDETEGLPDPTIDQDAALMIMGPGEPGEVNECQKQIT